MDTHEPSSSSSDTLPSAPSHSRSTPSRSQHSSPSPAPRRARKDAQHDRDRDRESAWGRSKLLSRLLTRDERDAAQVRTMLAITSERLAHETRRADDAEARIVDVLHQFRASRETALRAQADAARATEEVRLYKLRLDEAQREIFRAQEVVDRLEADRADAEAEAARARTLARRYKEERLVARAREEGRQQGFQEGLARGRDMGYYEARAGREREHPRQRQYRRPPVVAEEYSEEYEMNGDDNDNDNDSGSQPEEIVPIPRSPQPAWRPPSRLSDGRATQRSPPRATNSTVSVSDASPIAAPSPIRPPARPPAATATPEPIPIQDPGRSRSRSRVRDDGPIVPIPIHNPMPSPSHPPVDVPPDNYIPYMSSDHIMALPPPHELARPVAPRSPSPGTASHARDDPGVRTRDYAYAHDAAPAQAQTHRAFSNPGAPFSPQSRTSTNISQYDLVSARNGNGNGNGRSSGGGGRDALAGLRQMIGAVRPQSRSERSRVRERERERAAREDERERAARRERESSLERQRRSGAGTPLERLFKKRFRTRQSGSSGGVPDIMVESPTTATVSRASTIAAANQPHLLSPEMHQPSLPPPADAADFAVSDSDPRPLPPLPEFYLTTPSAVGIADEDEQQLPAGFVPMGAAGPPHDFAAPKAKGPRYSYEVAPIPPGVVYPDPPGRRSTTPGRRSATPHGAAGVALPPSPSSTPSPRRRRGSLSGHLSPLSLPLAFVASPSARAPSD
ncbi:hypothetical protein IEO21_07058 [Rhodonia placenta]|uniref:Uncharacterized protein n=1 Tax=Rhodonia placenta TaxID=104341 RepID=A0A8H7U009_9APHY|nr:hypothetical protein IEO21_07058 [Postia placenta]